MVEERRPVIKKKNNYCCYYIIPDNPQPIPPKAFTRGPMKVFICGVCKRELARHPMGGIKSMELVVEECCGDYWQKW